MKEKIIGLKELRENMTKYATQVQLGRSITVYKRSKPFFKLVPIDDDDDENNWETLIDFRKFPGYENGIPASDLLTRLRKINAEEDAAERKLKGQSGQAKQILKKTQQGWPSPSNRGDR